MMSKKVRDTDTDEEIRDAFLEFDRDCDGYLSHRELKLAMSNFGERMTDEEVDAMIVEADLDGDGKVSYDGQYFFCPSMVSYPLI